ncbi:translation initiation factor IF-2 N-terminal domain-containing protein, partial [Chamaesiphon sp. VAR_69_metabat_338]|uniref:translation initiation factor IF-2 N-terminal domain-containing protein n=1 Tax=Chamaesiphon sp. VAR_69_metabat_338 TaxID=2964704 RepID=UPI00286DF9DF
MNNGKVRIYELSKELNLENKDLLGICEGLNIVVKSHSSSISEAEAEQIVKAANEKFPDRQNKAPRQILADKVETATAPKSDAPKAPQNIAPAATNSPSQSAPPRPTEPRTRILQIEHKSDSQTKPSLMPQPPLNAQQPPLRPSAPPSPNVSRPVVRPTPVGEGATVRRAEVSDDANANRVARVANPVQPPAPKPQLSGPPARPNADNEALELNNGDNSESNSTPVARSSAPNKPIPKSQIVKSDAAPRPGVGAPTRSPGTGVPRKPVAKSESDAPPLNRPPARIVQIKPQGSGPTRPGAPGKDGAATEKDESTATPSDLELKRPPLRKPVNKGKGWSKEEEEIETAKAKVPAKGKRVKTVVIDEDDEDDDLDGNDNSNETIVSLSIARPAKQKIGTGGGIRPAAVPAQRKRPVMKGDQQAKERGNNNKREQKNTVEKPESITLMGSITVRDLAEMLMVPETEIVKQLFFKGIAISVTQILDAGTATAP